MTAHDERDVQAVAEALIEAAARAHFDHSHRGSRGIDGEDLTWADEVDAPYGKGAYRAMMRPVVAAVLDALDLPGRERRAKAEALREAADDWNGGGEGSPADERNRRWLKQRATRIESEEADDDA